MKRIKNLVFFAVLALLLMFTAIAANAAECNHRWSLAEKEGAPCKGYTTIYVCSECYAIDEEKSAPTQSHKWIETYSEPATCTKGGVWQGYCELCRELKSETPEAPGHKYTYALIAEATCTKDARLIGTCQVCDDTNVVVDVGSALGHNFAGEWIVVVPSDCLEKGVSKQLCTRCGAGLFRDDDKFGPHKDKDGDRKCDLCGESLSIFTPVAPDNDNKYDCSCNCHKGGIKGFFWKIGNFFCKLFRIKSKQVCDCGIYHF